MKRYLIKIIVLFAILLPGVATAQKAGQCIDWGKIMTLWDIDHLPKNTNTVLLQSFDNYTGKSEDDWLSVGIPLLIGDYLTTGRDVTVLSGVLANYHPSSISPQYLVSGMFQHIENRLRIFVKLNQGSKLIKQWQLDMLYPENKQLFDNSKEVAMAILEILSPKYDKKLMDQIHARTYVVSAYENYIRGLISYWSFIPETADVTQTWFEQSKKADYNYWLAYKGLSDLYIFLALYNKQMGMPSSGFYERAEAELAKWEKFKTRPIIEGRPKGRIIKNKEEPVKVTNRYLLANASYLAGLHALELGQNMEAAKYFEESTAQTPEDPMSWFQLAKARDLTGDKHKASAARAKAFELNRCLQ